MGVLKLILLLHQTSLEYLLFNQYVSTQTNQYFVNINVVALTPSTVSGAQYPHPDQLPPKTQSSLASTTISFQSEKSDGKETLGGRHSAISSQNLTPSPHPDSISPQQPSPSITSPTNTILVDRRPILPDSRLPNIRRHSDPTLNDDYAKLMEKDSTSSSLSSKPSSIFNFNRNNDNQSVHSDQSSKNRFLEKENQVVPGARRKYANPLFSINLIV